MSVWPQRRLRDLGEWFGGGTPSKSRAEFWTDGTVPWVSPKDMGPQTLRSTQDHITAAALAQSAARLIPRDSVALVVRSGILERTLPVALVPFETTLNQDMKALVPSEHVDPRWVAWGLRAFERDLLRTCRKAGTTVASMEMPRLYEFELPVPPLDEQRRIVEILEDHLSRLDAAGAVVDASRRRLTRFQQAIMVSALDAAAADPTTSLRTIGELAQVGTGATPLKSRTDYYSGGDIPWVTSADLAVGRIETAAQFITALAVKETSVRLWPAGTLLVAMYGEGKTRGTVAELGFDSTTNQACAAIQLADRDDSLRAWVRMALEAQYLAMRRLGSGGVQPNLNLGLVRRIEIPVPSAEMRASLLEARARQEEAQRALADELMRAQRRGSSLRRALLNSAFSGRLTGRSNDLDRVEEIASP